MWPGPPTWPFTRPRPLYSKVRPSSVLFVELPTYGRCEAGVSSTNAIHENDTSTITAPAAASVPTRRQAEPGAHTMYASAMPGITSAAASVFVLNASPTSTALAISQRRRPLSVARRPVPAAATISRISSASTPLSRETATNEGNTAIAVAPASAASVPARRAMIR